MVIVIFKEYSRKVTALETHKLISSYLFDGDSHNYNAKTRKIWYLVTLWGLKNNFLRMNLNILIPTQYSKSSYIIIYKS